MLTILKRGKISSFIPFVMLGDPSIEASEEIVDLLIEEGADVVELGIPFSESLADGPVIQAAAERGLKNIGGAGKAIEVAARIHARHPGTPLILFTYYNPIFKMGLEKFAREAAKAGVAGALVVDLPPEEAHEYLKAMQTHGLKTVFLASPTTEASRVKLVAQASSGFIYYVSRTGVTGVQQSLSLTLGDEVAKVRAITDKNLAIGFGISTGAHAKAVAKLGDAVVVGSAFVKLIAQHASDQRVMHEKLRVLARELVGALREESL